uniref:Ran guanine nucleotide release factor n=1 Tax=Physcomitrium patens TaxID=3218 RepID=A0A7I4EHC2_PHYPA
MMKDEVTTPCDSAHAPQTDLVQKLQEEFAGIALDPSSNGSDVCECDTANAPMPITAIPTERPENMILFGGAITCSFPRRYTDVSDVREVPNNQEAFVDANRDESFIVELLELKENVTDAGSARWFLEDLTVEQASENSLVVEEENSVPAANVPNLDANTTVNAVIGTMVYLANIRLRVVGTDILVIVYEPLVISEHSESAQAVGAGATVPALQAGLMPAADVFKQVLFTFNVHDWSLFGSANE